MTFPRVPGTPPPLELARSSEDDAGVRREDHTELNRLPGQATRCLEDMDFRSANEALERAREKASGLSRSRTPEVKM